MTLSVASQLEGDPTVPGIARCGWTCLAMMRLMETLRVCLTVFTIQSVLSCFMGIMNIKAELADFKHKEVLITGRDLTHSIPPHHTYCN